MIPYEFDPTIYPYMVWIVIEDNPAKIPDLFIGYDGNSIEDIEADTARLEAFTMPVIHKDKPSHGVIMYFRSAESMTYELVAHESSHAAKYMFSHIGADMREHEPFEFVVGWIASCCEKVKDVFKKS